MASYFDLIIFSKLSAEASYHLRFQSTNVVWCTFSMRLFYLMRDSVTTHYITHYIIFTWNIETHEWFLVFFRSPPNEKRFKNLFSKLLLKHPNSCLCRILQVTFWWTKRFQRLYQQAPKWLLKLQRLQQQQRNLQKNLRNYWKARTFSNCGKFTSVCHHTNLTLSLQKINSIFHKIVDFKLQKNIKNFILQE